LFSHWRCPASAWDSLPVPPNTPLRTLDGPQPKRASTPCFSGPSNDNNASLGSFRLPPPSFPICTMGLFLTPQRLEPFAPSRYNNDQPFNLFIPIFGDPPFFYATSRTWPPHSLLSPWWAAHPSHFTKSASPPHILSPPSPQCPPCCSDVVRESHPQYLFPLLFSFVVYNRPQPPPPPPFSLNKHHLTLFFFFYFFRHLPHVGLGPLVFPPLPTIVFFALVPLVL